jgi:hypothetical protein
MQRDIVVKRRLLKREMEEAVGGAMRVGVTGYPLIREDLQPVLPQANTWAIVERRPYLWDYTTAPVSACPMDALEVQAVQRARDAIANAGYVILNEYTNQQATCFQLQLPEAEAPSLWKAVIASVTKE